MANRRPEPQPAHLNLVPVMNLVTILIPFLLLSAQFVAIAVIETELPAICSDCEPPASDAKTLELKVVVDRQGIRIDGEGTEVLGDRVLACAGPCDMETYDWAALGRGARTLHEQWPEVSTVTLVPGPAVPYEVVLQAMDVLRDDGEGRPWFPNASIGVPRS